MVELCCGPRGLDGESAGVGVHGGVRFTGDVRNSREAEIFHKCKLLYTVWLDVRSPIILSLSPFLSIPAPSFSLSLSFPFSLPPPPPDTHSCRKHGRHILLSPFHPPLLLLTINLLLLGPLTPLRQLQLPLRIAVMLLKNGVYSVGRLPSPIRYVLKLYRSCSG